jgi:hypothetical protein
MKRGSPTGGIRFIVMFFLVCGFGCSWDLRGKFIRNAFLVLCNRYGLPIAAGNFGEFQEASEAPVSIAILAERATRKFAKRTAARRVELKMARRPRCVSLAGRTGHAFSSRLGGGPF